MAFFRHLQLTEAQSIVLVQVSAYKTTKCQKPVCKQALCTVIDIKNSLLRDLAQNKGLDVIREKEKTKLDPGHTVKRTYSCKIISDS